MSAPTTRARSLIRGGAVMMTMFTVMLTCAPANEAQDQSPMEQRLNQQLRILASTDSPEAFRAAAYGALEELTANRVPMRSKGLEDQTGRAAEGFRRMARGVADALEEAVNRFPEAGAEVVEIKRTVEHWIEMSQAIGTITESCGEGDNVREAPCDELVPLLDEETGHELDGNAAGGVIKAPYSLKLRGPHIPRGFASWEEDVTVTDPIAPGECVAIFKETRGLMLRLRLERIIIVNDPWESVFGVPRGTKIPIWTLEFVPSQYGKTWNICNTGKGLETTVRQRVKQDLALNYFWRYYRKSC